MKISTALAAVSQLYIETAPFIYYTESRAGYVVKMREILAYMRHGQLQVITAAVTLTEALMKPLQNNDQNLVTLYHTMFYHTTGVSVVSINATIGEAAAHLRAQYGIRTPDALHLATAIETGCDAFLTNDLALKRVSQIPVLALDDLDI